MNREQRRQAARDARRYADDQHPAGCACSTRRLVPIDSSTDCPACGRPSRFIGAAGVDMPTAAPFGTTTVLEVGCGCGATYEVPCLVD